MSNGSTLGKTPYTYRGPGSKTPKQFKLQLKGYGDNTVEFVPNRAEMTYTIPLEKGATKPGVVTKLPETPPTNTGSGAVTKPDTTTVTVKQPDEPQLKGSDATPEVKPPDVKPPDTQKPKEDCPDDEQPCLKTNIPGMGSGSK
jgi:hypothetical protein